MCMYLSRYVLCLQIGNPWKWGNVTKDVCSSPEDRYKLVK